MEQSVHSRAGVYCNSCHGGDPNEFFQEDAMDPAKGYIGIPSKPQTVKLCGTCHADVEAMNFYGIPTDQLARYKTSRHGQALLEHGDNKVAACTDCHGSHDIIKVDAPNSPVHPLNLPETCNQCHGSRELMDTYGLPSDTLKRYRNSVHGIALYEKKDLSVAHCARCHGSHGAVPPGVREVSSTCGKCHPNEREFFRMSTHAGITDASRFNECVSCHGHHEVQAPGPALYDTSCIHCHDSDSAAFHNGQDIKQLFLQASGAANDTAALIRKASIEGLFVENEAALLEQLHSKLLEMEPSQHSLSLEKLGTYHATILDTAKTAQAGIEKKYRWLWWRKAALIPIWIFIASMMTALWTLHKRLKDRHEEDPD
ncbi:cytochrome c3 family protein [Coraliomargarita parva]|uniref:cytochrome c3 family protein n=1 Tax=Coraliomargarita parva TaxID=3014050 RepID=UPI0022B48715|nr:cytochrome c3 family protein [Coraliomargarita parva]